MGNRTISSWGQLIPLRPGSEPSSDESGERRAWVRYVSDLITLCEPTETGQSETFLAQVRNISRGGVNLVLEQQFDTGSILSVELPGPNGEPGCTLLACVIYVAPKTGDGCAVGCSFVRELSDDDLQPYGAKRVCANGEDQRTWVRFACDIQATYRIVRVTERKPAPARVTDISPRGVGLLVTRSIRPGTVLSVELQNPNGQSKQRMFSCVVRSKEVKPGEWALGCNFIRELTDEEMNSLAPQGNTAKR